MGKAGDTPGKETVIFLHIEMAIVLLQRHRLSSGQEGLNVVEVETRIFCSSFPLKIKPVCAE